MSSASKNSGLGRTALFVVGLIAAVAIVTIVSSLVILKPWQSDEYKECVATLEQLNGGEDVPDSVVETECAPYE
ncbi:MAG TPA: hypothetical protein VJR50_11050 [Mycobacterium sp.]|nr:hypothetical protein [Mycobacterium sp.]